MKSEPTVTPTTRPDLLHSTADAEVPGRLACALDRLWTDVATSEGIEAMLGKLLQILLDAIRFEVGVVRLREGEQMRSRAAVGLEEEVVSGFSTPLEPMPAAGLAEECDPLRERHDSELMRKRGLRSLYRLPLIDRQQLLGVIFLGASEPRQLTPEDKQLLDVLAPHAAAAVALHNEHETLRRAIQTRDEVLSVVAHDLRNPLNVVTIAAGVLLRQLVDPSWRRLVDRIMRGVQRAERMVRDLLEISAIEGRGLTIERRWIEPADLILTALESQQSLDANAAIIFASDLSPDLPPINVDEERLLEVFENLIGNALKFTEPGGSITVGATHQDGAIVISVRDSGAGIPEDELPHIFDRFWQARKAQRHGTGLGLTICKAIVEAHGGRIWAESTVGGGTTMYFTIPAVHPGRMFRPEMPDVANILLVDDRLDNLLSLRAILERPDYRLVSATSGEEALKLALRETFCVALVDVSMPGMNGFEVAEHMKALERSRDIPIIFVTAFGDDPEEIHRAYAAGAADYLVKPLATEIVRKKVAVFVELRRRHQSGHRRAGGAMHPGE